MAVRFLGTYDLPIRSRAYAIVAVSLLALSHASCEHEEDPGSPTAPSAPSVVSVTVTLVPVTPEYQAVAVAAFSDGSSREVTAEAQWTSSNPGVATVSTTGRVLPVAAGSTEIQALFQSVTGRAALTVSQPALLQPNYRVSGTILDALDQVGVQGVLVRLVPEGGSPPPAAVTSSSGTYQILGSWSGPPMFNATITVQHNGCTAQSVQRTLDFVLPRGPRPADGTRVDCNAPPL